MYPVDKKYPISFDYLEGYSKDGITSDDLHHGVDIATPKGTKLWAPVNGVVYYAQEVPSWGKFIAIKFESKSNLYRVYLAHLSNIGVKVGEKVKKFQPIGLTGNSGKYTTGPHLHVETRVILGRGEEHHVSPHFILT